MGGVLCRSVELVNAMSPGVVLEIMEVEGDERRGRLIVRLETGESREIKGSKFINRSLRSRLHWSIHVTAVLPGGETARMIFRANYFAENGKVIFRLVGEELRDDPVVIPDLRRLRFFTCVGGN
ncbi:uncharacterized protein LOC126632770 isoform X2 [Malus sylvestris]|uniref:uncharacterized protein LOC126632770 isoform X2 n=1 Tax=Malus sylvestris TaxID=3752 RepID=UPI0021ACAE08|nr:uncharacterized protein LOC126632770 isoform X2 [Malus sylvestris]XP_050159205.1 uncharacterized protein LOC126632770 isoform X2 [Malus sylvestris]